MLRKRRKEQALSVNGIPVSRADRCPNCGGDSTVYDVRVGEKCPFKDMLYRRRRCRECYSTWMTYEVIVSDFDDMTRKGVDAVEGDAKIGKRLYELRVEAGLTQLQVADELFISRSGYNAIERGKNSLSLYLCDKLAYMYDVSTDYIIRGGRRR